MVVPKKQKQVLRKNCDKMIETVTKVQNLAIVGRVGGTLCLRGTEEAINLK